MIPFNKPTQTGKECSYIQQAFEKEHLCGDGYFSKMCQEWFEQRLDISNALLVSSGSAALDMAALLSDIHPGDEVIMPSFTFVSTANAFVLRGAKIVFVDIREDTMNIDEKLIEDAITERTKAIVPVHYAGVPCEMDTIMNIAFQHSLLVIEDAAQAIMCSYNGKAAGTIGNFGCMSFHETKNIMCGEGGLLIIRDKKDTDRAEIIREKGTNRNQFFRGMVDKYTWVDLGSSFLASELNAACLFPQLKMAEEIISERLVLWNLYYENMKELADSGRISLPVIPKGIIHNGHIFYIKVKDLKERTDLIEFLKSRYEISATFHYIPLHSSPGGKKFSRFHGIDRVTTKESERLVRLPIFYGMKPDDVLLVCEAVNKYYDEKK